MSAAVSVLKVGGFTLGGWACWQEGHGFVRHDRRGKVVKITPSGTITCQYQGGERTFRRSRHGGYTDWLRPATPHEIATWVWLARWRDFKRLRLSEVERGRYTIRVHDQACATPEQCTELIDELTAAAKLLDERPEPPA